MSTPLPPLDLTVTAPIEKDGAFATFVTVPGSAEALGTRRAVKVGGTIDGHEFAATLMPSGSGPIGCPCAPRSAGPRASPGPGNG